MRYTEYHSGKPVIKDKALLSDAMENWQDMRTKKIEKLRRKNQSRIFQY